MVGFDLYGRVVLLVLAAWFTWGGFSAFRTARSLLPVLCLDDDGLECAYGRLRWADVESIETTDAYSDSAPTLDFRLRPDTVWRSVETGYNAKLVSRYGDQVRVFTGLIGDDLSLEIVNRYYDAASGGASVVP